MAVGQYKLREAWGYSGKPRTCCICEHFSETFLLGQDPWQPEKMMKFNIKRRCKLGKFPIGPRGCCDKWLRSLV
jgi:hypothetical protein